MLHLDVMTKGNEFKDTQNDTYIVTDNVTVGNKILIELEKQSAVVAPAEDQIIPEV